MLPKLKALFIVAGPRCVATRNVAVSPRLEEEP